MAVVTAVMREERRAGWRIVGGAAALLGLLALVAVERGPIGAYNFSLYRRIADAYGDGQMDRLPPPIAAYADFTPLNLRIYQVMTRVDALFVSYQLVILLAGLALLATYQERLGLSLRALAAMSCAVVACGFSVLYGYEDKATFFTIVLLAAICVGGHWLARGASLGLLFGWTGLGLFALPLAVIRGRDRMRAAVMALVVVAGCSVVAGSFGRTLIDQRLEREARAPFWFSLGQLAGPLYSPTLRNAALVGASAVILWRYWRSRIDGAAAVIALVAVNLAASNSTDATRIAAFVPLGALVLASGRARVTWGLLAACWGTVAAAELTGAVSWFDDPNAAGLSGVMAVMFVNVPLLVAAGVALVQDSVTPYFDEAHDTSPAQPPSAVTSPA